MRLTINAFDIIITRDRDPRFFGEIINARHPSRSNPSMMTSVNVETLTIRGSEDLERLRMAAVDLSTSVSNQIRDALLAYIQRAVIEYIAGRTGETSTVRVNLYDNPLPTLSGGPSSPSTSPSVVASVSGEHSSPSVSSSTPNVSPTRDPDGGFYVSPDRRIVRIKRNDDNLGMILEEEQDDTSGKKEPEQGEGIPEGSSGDTGGS
jgi:hypothetical protein